MPESPSYGIGEDPPDAKQHHHDGKFKRAWYEGNDGSSEHYNWTRYYALNLHAVFPREHWNGVVLKAPSMQEKSGRISHWHLPYPHRRSTNLVPMQKDGDRG